MRHGADEWPGVPSSSPPPGMGGQGAACTSGPGTLPGRDSLEWPRKTGATASWHTHNAHQHIEPAALSCRCPCQALMQQQKAMLAEIAELKATAPTCSAWYHEGHCSQSLPQTIHDLCQADVIPCRTRALEPASPSCSDRQQTSQWTALW